MTVFLTDISNIRANPEQPRKTFDEERLEELCDSIARHGLLQPILVRKTSDGYEIIAGERRYRACKKLGMKQIPCILREGEDMQEIALIENLQREDLGALEKAQAIADFMSEKGLTQSQAARLLAKTRSYIANSVRLLHLDAYSKNLLQEGRLTEGHAKALLSVKDETRRRAIADQILQEGLSVRKAEQLTQFEKNTRSPSSSEDPNRESHLLAEAEQRLTELFGSKVHIRQKDGKNSGTICIEYYSEEQLLEITDLLFRTEGER